MATKSSPKPQINHKQTTLMTTRRKAKRFLRESHGRQQVVDTREEQASRHGALNTEWRRVKARHEKVHENFERQSTVWEKKRNASEFDTAPTPKSERFTHSIPCSSPLEEHTECHPHRQTMFPMKNAKTKGTKSSALDKV